MSLSDLQVVMSVVSAGWSRQGPVVPWLRTYVRRIHPRWDGYLQGAWREKSDPCVETRQARRRLALQQARAAERAHV